MTGRDRLIELVEEILGCDIPQMYIDMVADHLLANGVIVPPCEVGE